MNMKTKTTCAALALISLAACGGGGADPVPFIDGVTPVPAPEIGGAVRNVDDSYTVTTGDEVIELPPTNVFFNGQRSWSLGSSLQAGSFEDANVLAIGGVQNGAPFAGITGTPVVRTGSAAFDGLFSVNTPTLGTSGRLTLSYDFAEGTLQSTSGNLTVDGSASASGEIAGTVSFQGSEADFEGGFFGTDTVAAAFASDTIAGVFSGTEIAPE